RPRASDRGTPVRPACDYRGTRCPAWRPPWGFKLYRNAVNSALLMASPIITEALRALVDRRDLSRIEAAAAMDAIMSGAATNAQIAALLTALRMKGETDEERTGLAPVVREEVARVHTRGGEAAALTGRDREMTHAT